MRDWRNKHNYTIIGLLLSLLTFVGTLSAQQIAEPTYNSPYSILGLGDLMDQPFAVNAGMAGLSAAYHDPYHLNSLNPASLGWLRTTAFETAIFGRFAQLEAGDQTDGVWSGNLNYIALGFPLKNPVNEALDRVIPEFGAGMMFALIPYSVASYDIETSRILDEASNLSTREAFQGTGGTYRLNWGTGIRYKTFSAGVNLGYLFGRLNNTRQAFLSDVNAYYFDDFADDINVNGLIWNIGLSYDIAFKKMDDNGELKPTGKRLAFGLYGNSNSGFSTTSDRLYRRVYSVTNAQTLPPDLRSDTLLNDLGLNQEGTLPASFTFGVHYEDQNKLIVGAEFSSSLWSNYRNEAKPDVLNDSYRISGGVEWTPEYLSYNNYFKRIRYRVGAFYQTDPRSFSNEQLTKVGVTLGLGFPLILPRQQTSFINLAIEAGQFGLEEAISENYIKFTLGFTLNDNLWFFKRKYE
ncbi:MAG: hypothetical protein AAF806_06190 [Bacteroidota bacterium]